MILIKRMIVETNQLDPYTHIYAIAVHVSHRNVCKTKQHKYTMLLFESRFSTLFIDSIYGNRLIYLAST